MRLLVGALAVSAACGFTHGQAIGDGSGSGSGSADAPPDMMAMLDARTCVGGGGWSICVDNLPPSDVDLTGLMTLNTDGDSHCLQAQPADWTTEGQPASCIVAGTTIHLGDTLTVSGTRPLVLVASTTITINGTLDVSSHVQRSVGPGAGQFPCNAFGTPPPTDANNNSGGGGGAGGSFNGKGADGGKGSSNSGAQGKAAAMIPAPSTLRAGCIGQIGGNGNNTAGSGGSPGAGGGAVYLVAGTSITITGTIDASGAGGTGGDHYGGGGGGGSGGMIVLYAPAITAAGSFILTNGGGGEGGGDQNSTGNDGGDPVALTPNVQALGGTATGGGTDNNAGGRGFALAQNPTPGGNANVNDGGGGGGGGGAGFILTHKPLTGASVSPMPTNLP